MLIELFLCLLNLGTLQGNVERNDLSYSIAKGGVVYILLDESSSMYKNRLSVINLVNTISQYRLIKIVKFGNKKLHNVYFTGQNNKSYVITKKTYKPYGNSPVNDAIKTALEDINHSSNIDNLVIISDFHDLGSKVKQDEIEKLLDDSSVDIVKVKLGESNDYSRND